MIKTKQWVRRILPPILGLVVCSIGLIIVYFVCTYHVKHLEEKFNENKKAGLPTYIYSELEDPFVPKRGVYEILDIKNGYALYRGSDGIKKSVPLGGLHWDKISTKNPNGE